MAFVNEYIPKEDWDKYKFNDLNSRPRSAGSSPCRFWVIDRSSNIWLRKFSTSFDWTEKDGGFSGVSTWDFYWKGHLLTVILRTLDSSSSPEKEYFTKKKLESINIPKDIKKDEDEIISDLIEALVIYKDAGVLSNAKSYKLDFER